MTDYNVTDHWRADEPTWVKALGSALFRRRGDVSITVPLVAAITEVSDWVELAAADAWANARNRESLRWDIEQSVAAVARPGCSVALVAEQPLDRFWAAWSQLVAHPRVNLKASPGQRADPAWTDLADAAASLIATLTSDEATQACWDDLVATIRNPGANRRKHRALADLLFDQLTTRGLDADQVFREAASLLAYGSALGPYIDLDPDNAPSTVETRVAAARELVTTPAILGHVVVWLGYQGGRSWRLDAGRVTFVDAHWAVPNAAPDGQDFEHKNELWQLVEHDSLFHVAARVDEPSDVDGLVRVDLGHTVAPGAADRAARIVATILDVSIHETGGARPHLNQYAVLMDGRAGYSSSMVSRRETGFPDDHYGASITTDGIETYGPRLAAALAREAVPRFLAAAIDAQTAADQPFSRDMALRQPTRTDRTRVIPFTDQVVQHVAAYAEVTPDSAFDVLGSRWPHLFGLPT